MLYLRPRTSFYLSRRLFATISSTSSQSFIPVIDFSKFRDSRQSERKQVASQVVSAFKESGFIYLTGHGIPSTSIQNMFAQSKYLFALSPEKKDKLAWEDPRSNRGYVSMGRERVTQSTDPAEIAVLRERAPDCKESMEIGRDWDSEWKNQWPHENDMPIFKRTVLDFYQACHELHVSVMRSIALGLSLEEKFFDSKVNDQCHNLRLLSYPPMKTESLRDQGQARAGSHSDYGTLTLLFQDSVGGLEVQNPHTGEFVPAMPIPGTIVINVGDLLARWSNDVLRSTLHRVVAPQRTSPTDEFANVNTIAPSRQSIAFFCNPNFNTEITCLPGCGKAAKYPPVNAGDYIVGRLTVTYT